MFSRVHDPQTLDEAEMVSLAKRYSTAIASALLEGERQREQAVRDRDAIKLSCIQDHLANMKLMKNLADAHQQATERPEIRADELHLRHEFAGVEMAHQRVLALKAEMLECVGEALDVSTGEGPQTPVSVPGAVDPSGAAVDTPVIDRPTPASTYQ